MANFNRYVLLLTAWMLLGLLTAQSFVASIRPLNDGAIFEYSKENRTVPLVFEVDIVSKSNCRPASGREIDLNAIVSVASGSRGGGTAAIQPVSLIVEVPKCGRITKVLTFNVDIVAPPPPPPAPGAAAVVHALPSNQIKFTATVTDRNANFTPSATNNINIDVRPEIEGVYAVNHYFSDPNLKLAHIIKAEQNGSILTLTGHPDDQRTTTATRKLLLLEGRGYNLNNGIPGWKFWKALSWSNSTLALSTIPFKYRGKTAGPTTGEDYKTRVEGAVKNLGLLFNVVDVQLKRYRRNRPMRDLRISVGGWIAPQVYELDEDNTFGYQVDSGEEINQLYISVAAPTVTVVTSGIGIILAPLGYDLAVNETGRDWVYAGQPWHGLGLGIEIKRLVDWFE